MKLNKILLMIPVATLTTLPLVGCNKTKQDANVTITLVSPKEQKTESGKNTLRYEFKLSRSIDAANIVYEVSERAPNGKTINTVIKLNGTDLYLDVTFVSEQPGQSCTFDITFTIFGKNTKFETLTAIFTSEGEHLPDAAFIINEETKELEGLDPLFLNVKYFSVLKVPDHIVSIKANAFKDAFTETTNPTIKTLILNKNLTTIGENAFSGCNNIKTLDVSCYEIKEQCPITFGENVFNGWNNSKGTIKYNGTSVWFNSLDCKMFDASLPSNWLNTKEEEKDIIRYIPTEDYLISNTSLNGVSWKKKEEAPRHISIVKQVKIPNGITTIGDYAFYNSDTAQSLLPTNIISLSLPEGLTIIGDYAFSLASFTNFVNSIDEETLILPDTVTTIGVYAFCRCLMKAISLKNTLTTINKGAFYQCSNVVGIDVSEIKTVPEKWSQDSTTFGFNEETEGIIHCIPSASSAWRTYFGKAGINFSKWAIAESIEIVKDGQATQFTPSVVQIQGYFDKTKMLSRYHTDISTNEAIIIDDITKTIYNNVGDQFTNLTITVTNAFYANKGFNIMIYYNAKLKNDENEYSGIWMITNFDTESSDNVVIQKKIALNSMTLQFRKFLSTSSALVVIENTTTPSQETTTFSKAYSANTPLSDISENSLGKILSKLGLFVSAQFSNEICFNLDSYYLGACNIN